MENPNPNPQNAPEAPPQPAPLLVFYTRHRILTYALIAVFLIAFLASLGYAAKKYIFNANTGIIACTTDAKVCPDGTGVGRTGPNCEFAPCPTAIPHSNQMPIDNSEHGYKITLPEGIAVFPEIQPRFLKPEPLFHTTYGYPETDQALGITGYTKRENQTTEDWWKEQFSTLHGSARPELPVLKQEDYSFEVKKLGNNTFHYASNPNFPWGEYYLNDGDRIIIFYGSLNDQDQILSTFQFTNGNTIDFPIPELGIKIQIPETLGDLTYEIQTNNDSVSAHFSTTSLTALDRLKSTPPELYPGEYYCDAEDSPLGTISKLSTKPNWETMKHIENNYYIFSAPQAACSTIDEVNDKAAMGMRLLKESFQTAEPI